MLTCKQHELLMFVKQRLEATGVSPSFDEMKEALNLRSKSGIHRLITALEERGFIRRLPHRARALEVIKLPHSMVPATAGANANAGSHGGENGFSPNVIKGDFRKALAGANHNPAVPAVQIPLYGKIAAGTPVEALRDPTAQFDVPTALLAKGEHYALTIEGDSMVEAGINDGDIAIIQRCDGADNGAIVVALVDDQEATLKRLRRRGNSVALEPANPTYETRIFPPDRVKVQGKLVGIFRRF